MSVKILFAAKIASYLLICCAILAFTFPFLKSRAVALSKVTFKFQTSNTPVFQLHNRYYPLAQLKNEEKACNIWLIEDPQHPTENANWFRIQVFYELAPCIPTVSAITELSVNPSATMSSTVFVSQYQLNILSGTHKSQRYAKEYNIYKPINQQ